MAAGEEKNEDFYSVLGLKKECTASELRIAYKKLALRWHPDRCSASGNSNFIEVAKKKFQAIQEAYSVLSNANKRFMYDLGVYENDDDENEMGDFLGEMVDLMAQTKPTQENAKTETFEDLQALFEEMFQENMQAFSSVAQNPSSNSSNNSPGQVKMEFGPPESHAQKFCLGAEGSMEDSRGRGGSWRRRSSGKQKASSRHSKISV
ncbi:DnaJ domain [Macleaya cordata]|uniref:DnaJ domain n=1 Tax=Macleaya cordata TaxID=56857 RepID=A0A200QPF7_MACCD|nr:DnaJ domain [Macleaya cordata]